MSLIGKIEQTELSGPFENSVTVYHSNGLIWASLDQWCLVLQAPYFMVDFLSKTVELQSAQMKGGTYTAVISNNRVYRWPPVAAALDSWHRSWMIQVAKGEHATLPLNRRTESTKFAQNVARLKQWGYELQERELQSAMNSKMTPNQSASGLTDVNQAIQAISSLAHVTKAALEKHGQELAEHSERIDEIAQDLPGTRDPQAFVTIKQRCIERALSLGFVVEGRMNLPQACGQFLQKNGASKGASCQERLDGSNRVTDVATWRRIDIDRAIEHYLPEFTLAPRRKQPD